MANIYSPRIHPSLIKRLYILKQSLKKKIPMTQMVNKAVEEYLKAQNEKKE
jgi:hypothetical protein